MRGRGTDVGFGFGGLLRQLRLARGMTQEELADAAGLTSRAIRSLEAGSAQPRRATVSALGATLGLGPGRLETLVWICGLGPRPGSPAAGSGTAARTGAVPAQLPRDISDFVGRGEVSATLAYGLLAAALDGTMGVVAINGLGGIGKTALATHLAHQVRTAFPDGQLFVDLRGGSGPGRDPDSVLADMLRDLGVQPTRIPAGPEAKSALLRSCTAERAVLLVLDNARDTAQIRPLLPASPACGVLVTSRRVLATLEGARHATLDPLTAAQSRELVESFGPAPPGAEDEEALREILACCGGLPLALRIAAARLATPDGPSASAFAAQLGQATRRLDGLVAEDLSVRGTLATTVDLLATADERGRLARRALGFFGRWPGPDIAAPCMTAALGCGPHKTRAALRHLVDTNLLQQRTSEPEPEPRYAPHDLVRAYVAEQPSQPSHAYARDDLEAGDDPVVRAFDWYLHAMDRAITVFADYYSRPDLPGPPPAELPELADPAAALAWSQLEYPNVVALIRHGAAMRWDSRVPVLAVLAVPYGEQRMRLSEWIETSLLGLECARRAGERLLEGRLLTTLAAAYRWTRQYDSALECAGAALKILDELGELQRIGVLLVARGRIHHTARDFPAAAESFREAVGFLRVHGSPYFLASALNQLGMALTRAGEPGEAVGHQLESLRVAREAGIGHYEGTALLNLSISYMQLGRLDDADAAIGEAAAAQAGLAQPVVEAEIQRQAAEVRHAQGRTQEAFALLRQAIATMEALDYPDADDARARLQEMLEDAVRG